MAKISHISLYGIGSSYAHGSVHFELDGGVTQSVTLKAEDIKRLESVLWDIAIEKKQEAIKSIMSLERPPTLEAPKHSIDLLDSEPPHTPPSPSSDTDDGIPF